MRKILKENIYRQKLFKRLAVLYPRFVAYQAVNEEMDQILPAQTVKKIYLHRSYMESTWTLSG